VITHAAVKSGRLARKLDADLYSAVEKPDALRRKANESRAASSSSIMWMMGVFGVTRRPFSPAGW
jgi:hypothetical protein